jgi:hypothetical protein
MSVYSKIVVALRKMRYRVLLYLSIIAVITLISRILAFVGGVASFLFFEALYFINPLGLLLAFLFYGRPSLGYSYPTMAGVLYMFGFFVEMFIVGEIIVSLRKGSKAARISTKA